VYSDIVRVRSFREFAKFAQGRARIPGYLTTETLARVFSDVIIVNGCCLVALVLNLLLDIAHGRPVGPEAQLVAAFEIYASNFLLLTLTAMGINTLSGFYSPNGLYHSRFKMLVVFESVSLTYLLFGVFESRGLAQIGMPVAPARAMVLGWGLTLVATAGARLWSGVWRVVVQREPQRPEVNRKGPIRRVLVIGGAGYIGSVLCRQLLRQGYSVRVLDTLLYGKDSLKEIEDHPRFELIVGDSRDVGAVFSAMLGSDAVVHLGELVGDPACAVDEELTLEINMAATRMLAEAARGYGVKRFIYASSCSVYGAADELLNERSALNPVSLYARAKISAEKTLLELSGEDFNPIILRLATVFGLSPRPRFDLVVNLLAAKAVKEGEITIFGGDQWRPFVHVTDVARAMIRCLQAPLESVKGQIFNVGHDEQNYTIRQIGEMVHRIVPEARLTSNGDDKDRRNYRVSFSKIHRRLGFSCHTTLEAGAREIVMALSDGRIHDHQAARYSNHKTLIEPSGQQHLRSRRISELYQPAAIVPLRAVSVATTGGR